MKRILIIAAMAAAAATVSCTKDAELESAAKSQDNLIAFNVNAQNATRADITTANINLFSATAIVNGTDTKYFDNVEFSKNGQTFNSANPYYWPEEAQLDFFAYAPVIGVQVPTGNTLVRTDYKTFTVTTPNQKNKADYTDLVFANTNGKAKADGTNGVAINFRHAESKIVVKVKNSAPNLKFKITDWKLAFVDSSAIFEYKDNTTDGNNNGKLAYEDWSANTDYSVDNWYTFDSEVTLDGTVSNPVKLDGEMILIPQQTQMAVRYTDGNENGAKVSGISTADETSNVGGSYLALKIKIYNQGTDVTVFSNKNDEWAIWPVAFDWKPGYKYTYVIDLCGGGYYEENHNDINPGEGDLDPILGDDAIIKFVNVTVDEWDEDDKQPQHVNMLLTDAIRRAAAYKPFSNGTIKYKADTVTMTAHTSDLAWPSYKPGQELGNIDDVNDNNVYLDIKNFFNGLFYAGSPVASITYNGADYTDAAAITNVIAKNFAANFWDATNKVIKASSAMTPISIILNGNAQDPQITASLKLEVTEDVTDYAKIAVNMSNKERLASGVFSYADGYVVLNAKAADFMWRGFPELYIEGEDINANENYMFKNIQQFIQNLLNLNVAKIKYNEIEYTSALELTKALAFECFNSTFYDSESKEVKSGEVAKTIEIYINSAYQPVNVRLIATK